MREFEISMPKLLTCPISLEIFNDPVTLCTGQTYDRYYIEEWFSHGNITCPVTMQKLHDLSFVPNYTVTQLIHQLLLKKGSPRLRMEPPLEPVLKWTASPPSEGSSLKHALESQDTSLEKKIQVIEQVRKILSQDILSQNEELIQMGLLPIFLGLTFGVKITKVTQEMMILVEKSLDFILNFLPFCCMNDLNALLEESKFENLKILLQDGNFFIKIRLCNLIQLIFTPQSSSSSSLVEEVLLAKKIANDTKITQALICSLEDNGENYKVSEASMEAILAIVSSPQDGYRENMVKQGLIDALVKYILEVEGKEKSLGAKATKALELMLELESGKVSFLVKEVKNEGVKALVKMVFRVSGDDLGSESAVNCLMKLCSESVEIREAVIFGGVVTQILLLLQSQCCGRVKTRARMLLKLLRSMWVKDPNHV